MRRPIRRNRGQENWGACECVCQCEWACDSERVINEDMEERFKSQTQTEEKHISERRLWLSWSLCSEELTFTFSVQEEEGQQSLECIQANQIFPKKSPVLEEENMQVRKPLPSLIYLALQKNPVNPPKLFVNIQTNLLLCNRLHNCSDTCDSQLALSSSRLSRKVSDDKRSPRLRICSNIWIWSIICFVFYQIQLYWPHI